MRERLYRLSLESLENRTMLDSSLPVAIVAGRALTMTPVDAHENE
jgi:hypothetical protein